MTRSVHISTLWVVVMINMAFADILGFMQPGFLAQAATGVVSGIEITPSFLLIAAVFVEIAIVMIYLSRALPRHRARIANLIAAPITILFIIGGGSIAPHYIFIASIETLCLLAILWLSWTWREAA